MLGLLKPVYKQKIIGIAEVRNVFNSPKFNVIAGCMVIEGIVKRNSTIRIVRNNIVIYEGELESLRRFKDDVNEIRSGMECGIGIKNYKNMCIGDQIEVYNNIEVKS
ncbi:translation initiation factor IF-2, partial [Buchnera aphidicola (Hormaphis cornu)]